MTHQRSYMLDTNTVSYLIKGKPIAIRDHLRQTPMSNICISTITDAELRRDVEKETRSYKTYRCSPRIFT
jgi:tRNA(fMet)-specific endonuclease VapC